MKTKQIFHWMLTAALVCGLGMSAASCNKDNTAKGKPDDEEQIESASVLTLDNDYLTRGIETDMQSAVIEVPVKCDGLWTATLSADAGWVQILDWQVTYEGDATLALAFDENLTKVDRTAALTLGDSYGEYRTVTVRQNYGYNGEAPDNGNGLAFANKGVGTGVNYDYALNVKLKQNAYDTFDPTRVHLMSNLFNISRIEELIARGALEQPAYREAVFVVNVQDLPIDESLVWADESLTPGGTGFNMASSFGVLAFRTEGDYSSRKQASRSYVDYSVVHNVPTSYVYLSPAELSEYAAANRKIDEDAEGAALKEIENLISKYQTMNKRRRLAGLNEDGLTADQQTQVDAMYDAIPILFDHAGIYSTHFKNIYNRLYTAMLRSHDTEAADQVLDLLDSNYGPFFIAGGEFGGSLTLHCKVDTKYLDNAATVTGSSADAVIEGLLSDTGYSTSYEEAYNLLRYSNMNLTIFGGNAYETADAMTQVFTSGNASELASWQGVLQDWTASLSIGDFTVENLLSKGAPVSFTLCPVWTLFNEPELREYAENYFLKKYASRNIDGYLGIMDGSLTPSADDLLNAGSDFWK